MTASTRAVLTWIGALLGVAGTAFVAARLYAYWGVIDVAGIGRGGYVLIVLLAVIYGAANLLLAFAWRELLRHLGVERPLRWTIWAYATSQLAKYAPGNVLQFLGRQALGVAAGIPNLPLAKSTLLELVVVGCTAALFAPLALPLVWPAIGWAVASGLFVLCLVIGWAAALRFWGSRIAAAALLHCLFLIVSGLCFAVAFLIVGGSAGPGRIAMLSGAFVVAWLAGLVTPGAPAGVGVREAVLLWLLSGVATDTTTLLAVVAGRLITVAGDLLFYAAGQLAAFRTGTDARS